MVARVLPGRPERPRTHTLVDAPPLPWITYVALAICLGTGVALAVVNKHDARASWLGGVFILAAAPLTNSFFNAHPDAPLAMLWFVRLEAFQPAFVWRFASEFPSPLVGRPAVMFRAISRLALAAGTFIALVNLSFIVWPDAGAAPWRMLFRPPIAPAGSLLFNPVWTRQRSSGR